MSPALSGNPFETELRQELKKIYARTLVLRVVAGLVSFLTVAAWVFVLVVAWRVANDELASWQTVTVSSLTFTLFALLFGYFVILPLVRMPRFSRLALEVESRKDFQHIVAAGYEFSDRSDAATRYSPELVREVVHQAVESVRGLQVRFLFLDRRQLFLMPASYLVFIILIAIAALSPSSLLDAGRALVAPKSVAAVEGHANLYGLPGNLTVLAGSDVEVKAIDFGDTETPVSLSYNLAEGFWKTESTSPEDMRDSTGSWLDAYSYTFHDIRSSVIYYFKSGGSKSPEYRIEVVHKPIVTELDVVLTPPPYTGEPADTLIDSGGNVQALEGTDVAVSAVTNNTLANALVQFGEADARAVNVSGRQFDFEFVALDDGNYRVYLEDDVGHKTDEPLVYGIEVYKDNPPVMDLLEPGADATLPRNLVVDVAFIASDDYGLALAELFYRKNGEQRYRRRVVPLSDEKGKREIAKTFSWDLSDVPLFPGNYVEYFLQVTDNNVVTGPGVTKSAVFHISVPTMAELYEKIQEEDSKRTDLLEKTVTESKELKDRLEKLSREFKKTEKMDWAQKKEVDKAIASQEQIEEKIDDIQQSLEETLRSLSDNQMTSQDIGEKMEEIQKLIENINDEALNQYVEELQEAMEKLNPDEIQKALENLNLSAEELLESLERTESLLKQIQQEQQMEELVRDAKDLMDEQEELGEQTADADENDPGEMSDLAKKQQEMAKKAEELAKKMKEMADGTESQELSSEMQDAAEEFSEGGAQESMEQASKELNEGDKQQAMESQAGATDQMISLFTRLVKMQMQMSMQSQQQASENLQRLAKSTLALSFKQESLAFQLRNQVSQDQSSDVRNLATDQQTYTRAVEQIANELHEISKRSLSVSETLLELLGQTIDNMRNTLLFLEQNKAFMGAASASQAVTNLNQATIELLTAAQNNMQGGGGGSTSDQMSALQQMLQQQQQILQQSQSLLQMRAAQEKLLQERQAAIERLAGQQRSLKETAERMQKDLKDNKRILGRVDKMVEEMEEVIRDLDSGVLDEQTVRNEERILSRLLDASRSVNSRDYEKKRLSASADDVFSNVEGGDGSKLTSQLLREEIRRAMSLKAPGEFEELIKLYFRALAEEAPTARSE